MVSFFGLRFGGDKKKAQKQPDKKQPPQQEQQQQQQQSNLNTLVEIQLAGHDSSQPSRRLSRPGTSNSTTGRNTNWRTAFSDTPAAASCIDLSSPHRQPSTGSKSLFLGSEVSKPSGRRASFFSLGSKETCLGVPVNVQSPLSQLQFDIQGRERVSHSLEMERETLEFENGLPSPPQSIGGGDELQLSVSATSRITHQSVVASSFNPEPLPSPVPSASLASEEKREIPVIRNVKAKRDTLTFHSPRRQSFIMAIEEANKEKNRLLKKNQGAGPAISTAMTTVTTATAMDSVTNEASSCGTLGMELMQSPVEMAEPHPFQEESPEQAETNSSKDISAEQREQQPNPDAELFGRIALKGFNSRMGSDTRSRGPPQPLRPLSISTDLLSTPATGVSLDRPLPSPLASKTPMVGDFPVDKGLPRGRLPPRPSVGPDGSTKQEEVGNETGDGFSLPAWDLDGSEPRRSAMPVPLFPGKTASSPTQINSTTPKLAMAPVLPSPSFAALEKVTSNDSIEVVSSFEISFDIPETSPITCDFPTLGK